MSRRTALTGLTLLTSAACSKLIFLAANVPASFGSYRRHTDVSYGDDPKQRMDIYVPDGSAAAPRPVVVFWYGGRWTNGDKADYRFVGAALAGLGYVAILPNYRHYPQVKLDGFMEDAARAALWSAAQAEQYGADPRRLYLMGHSAGAHIAVLVALDTRYFLRVAPGAPAICGVVGLSGPYDFLPLTDSDLEDMFGPPEHYLDSQPIHFVRGDAPPMLLVHGLRDQSVAPKNTINLAAALKAQGAHVTLQLYPKLDHADTAAALSIPARSRAPVLADIAAFVNRRQSS